MADDAVAGAGPARCRGFGVSDAMILLAGVALAMSGGVHLLTLLARTSGQLCMEAAAHLPDLPWRWPSFRDAIGDPLRNTLWYASQVVGMSLIGLTPAFWVLRLRRPRPPMRALLVRPGAVAGLAIVLGFFWITGALVALFPGRFDGMTAAPVAVGGTVAVAWIALALGRRWEPEPGWIDRLGRSLGWAAIGMALVVPAIFRI